jgi:hypothetical protein
VYEALRFLDPELLPKLVVMTGGAFTREAGEFLSAVAAPVLEKPFEASQLRTMVNALASREQHPASADAPAARPASAPPARPEKGS